MITPVDVQAGGMTAIPVDSADIDTGTPRLGFAGITAAFRLLGRAADILNDPGAQCFLIVQIALLNLSA